jgi:two-component SAPR family response regulator
MLFLEIELREKGGIEYEYKIRVINKDIIIIIVTIHAEIVFYAYRFI